MVSHHTPWKQRSNESRWRIDLDNCRARMRMMENWSQVRGTSSRRRMVGSDRPGARRCWLNLKRSKVGKWLNTMRDWVGICWQWSRMRI